VIRPDLFSIRELAALIGVSEARAASLVRFGKIAAIRVRSRRFVTRVEAEKFIAANGRPSFELLDGWLTLTDIARAAGLSRQTVQNLVSRGKIVTVRDPDGKHRIHAEAAADFVASLGRPAGFVSLLQIADRAQCCENTVRRAAKSGALPGTRVNGRTFVARSAAEQWIASRASGGRS
jgi:DNA-binding Xre family transcriptional regulator